MNAILLGLACTFFADFVVVAMLVYLERGGSRPWRRDWLLATVGLLAMHITAGMTILGLDSLASMTMGVLGIIGSSAWLLRGALGFLGRPLPRWYVPLVGLGCAVGLLSYGLGVSIELSQITPMLLWVGTWTVCGVVLLRHARGTGRWMAGGSLIAFSLHQLDYPLVASKPELLAWGLAVNGGLALCIGLGLVLLDVDRLREEGKRRQRRLDQMVDNAVVGIFRSAPGQGFLMVNQALVDMLGYDTVDEVLALSIPTQVAGSLEDRARLHAELDRSDRVSGFETTWKRQDGTPIRVELHERAVRDDDGTLVFFEGFARDVTRARLLEEELARSRRMEALGRLAGGVAHEFNNLLAIVRGNVTLLSEQNLADDSAVLLGEAKDAAERASELTTQLLALGQPAGPQEGRGDLRQVVKEVLTLLRSSLEVDIRIEEHLPDRPCPVPLDRSTLAQLVMNLALNARDAMPSGGRLTLGLAVVPAPEEVAAAAAVRLEVIDTGEGMSEEVRAHIFEPFFTTRDVGQGTGLGLATVFRVVQAAGGAVRLDSAVGVGTTFQLYLPLLEAPVEITGRRQRHESTAGGRGVVLLAEDEEGLLRLVHRLLSREGYQVHAFSDPRQALAFGREQAPDLILTDVAMPGLTGPELVSALAEVGVRPPVVFMSGFPDRVRGGRDLDGPLLTKPFSRDQLLAHLREAQASRDLESW